MFIRAVIQKEKMIKRCMRYDANGIESQREEYYKELGIPSGVPTMKGAYGDPENTGVGYNTIITELGDHSVPKNWEQYIIKKGKGESPATGLSSSRSRLPNMTSG